MKHLPEWPAETKSQLYLKGTHFILRHHERNAPPCMSVTLEKATTCSKSTLGGGGWCFVMHSPTSPSPPSALPRGTAAGGARRALMMKKSLAAAVPRCGGTAKGFEG
ncbi:hypothetical protein AAFF_G00384210 [Aldrovandia affinis]|uniref:Uncharacterized protein n=1 Tax=Aldrovandia affinis TaxID=143900 RepID=A0AAD7WLP5_9TELE|nr:hypothetical protein AAFF_G00384210 [Aldrovandia affinis]